MKRPPTQRPKYEAKPDTLRAFLKPGVVPAGETVWLLNGTYPGLYESRVVGVEGGYVQFRVKPGHNVLFTGNLRIFGGYTDWRGLTVRNLVDGGDYPGTGIEVHAPYTRLINNWVDRCGQGIAAWAHPGIEIYGNVITRSGWVGADGTKKGHGLYCQNATGEKLIQENIITGGQKYGIHAYGEQGKLNNMTLAGNMTYENAQGQFLWGGSSTGSENLTCEDNVSYATGTGRSYLIGYNAAGNKGLTFHRNFGVGQGQFQNWIEGLSVRENTFIAPGDVLCFNQTKNAPDPYYPISDWDSNVYEATKSNPFATDGAGWFTLDQWRQRTGWDANSTVRPPTGETRVFLRPNIYEPGRAHIAVYTPGSREAIINLDGLLSDGQPFSLYRVPDLETPLLTGSYESGGLSCLLNREFETFLVRGAA